MRFVVCSVLPRPSERAEPVVACSAAGFSVGALVEHLAYGVSLLASHRGLGDLAIEIVDQIGDFHSFEVRHVRRVLNCDRLQIVLINSQKVKQFCKF